MNDKASAEVGAGEPVRRLADRIAMLEEENGRLKERVASLEGTTIGRISPAGGDPHPATWRRTSPYPVDASSGV